MSQGATIAAQRAAQCWYSVRHLAWLLDLGATTVRRRIAAGEFGPPAGERPEDYIIYLGTDVRVSSLGYLFFTSSHAHRPDAPIVARSQGELRRKLAAQPNDGDRFPT